MQGVCFKCLLIFLCALLTHTHIQRYIYIYIYACLYIHINIYFMSLFKFRYVRTDDWDNSKVEMEKGWEEVGQGWNKIYVTHVSILIRFTVGLSLSSEFGGLASPTGEWKSLRGSSRSLPSYELLELLRLSTGERPTSCRDCCWGCCCNGNADDGVTRSRGGEIGSDLMLMFWLVLTDKLEPWDSWPPALVELNPGREKRGKKKVFVTYSSL